MDLGRDLGVSLAEFRSTPSALTSVTVTIYFVDHAGHSGSVAADTVVPDIPQAASTAALTIGTFTVESWYENRTLLCG